MVFVVSSLMMLFVVSCVVGLIVGIMFIIGKVNFLCNVGSEIVLVVL